MSKHKHRGAPAPRPPRIDEHNPAFVVGHLLGSMRKAFDDPRMPEPLRILLGTQSCALLDYIDAQAADPRFIVTAMLAFRGAHPTGSMRNLQAGIRNALKSDQENRSTP